MDREKMAEQPMAGNCRCGWFLAGKRKKRYAMGNNPFEIYSGKLYAQWQQARDEGRDVAALEEACRAVRDAAAKGPAAARDQLPLAYALYDALEAAAVRPGHVYCEPSDYAGILAQRPESRDVGPLPDRAVLRDRILAGWTGRVSGCLLGKPLEFWALKPLRGMLHDIGNYPVDRYIAAADFTPLIREKYDIAVGSPVNKQPWIDEIGDHAPIDDDTNYTVLNLRLLETFGRDFTPEEVLFAWVNWMPAGVCCTAERIAYVNALGGMRPPETAVYRNPYREWVGAQIRAEIFGWVNPGDPQAAAEMAYRDACVSHVRNGIYGEMFAAAMVAAAMVCGDVRAVIGAGLAQIPTHSRLAEAVRDTISDFDAGVTYEQAVQKLHGRYDENDMFDWCHTIPNAVIVVLSLLHGAGDFAKALGLCVQAAMDTDSNGAVVGAIMGSMLGSAGIPAYWGDCFGYKLASSVDGYHLMKLEELADRTLAVAVAEKCI